MRRQRGQNTTEFLVFMLLAVVSSIMLLAAYGGQIQQKIAGLAGAFSGHGQAAMEGQALSKVASYEAILRTKHRPIKMQGLDPEELQYSVGKED